MPTFRSVALVLVALTLVAASATAAVDLAVTLDVPRQFARGGIADVHITVRNLGSDRSEAVAVRVTGSIVEFTPRPSHCTYARDEIVCGVPSLAAGERYEHAVRVAFPDAPSDTLIATVHAANDADRSNDSASGTAELLPFADIVAKASVAPVHPGVESSYTVPLSNAAATEAKNVVVTVTLPPEVQLLRAPNCTRSGDRALRCTLIDLPRTYGISAAFTFVLPSASTAETLTFSASATSDTPEWNPGDNVVTETVPVLRGDVVTMQAPASLDEQNRGTYRVTVRNPSTVDSGPVTLLVSLGLLAADPVVLSPDGWSCLASRSQLTCTATSIAAGASKTLDVQATYAGPYSRVYVSTNAHFQAGPNGIAFPDAYTDVTAVFYRDYVVRSTADDGAGSLRDAIARANAECTSASVPCRIAFHVDEPLPAGGVYTIRPLTALPPIVAGDVAVDGETQTAFGGDTNPDGPEILLDGGYRENGLGALTFAGRTILVQGLAIGRFMNAIYFPAEASDVTIRRNYLGTDATGRTAAPNVLRGIMADTLAGRIEDNVISGNLRSGIWILHPNGVAVRRNRIGVTAHGNDPLPNGASGIFFGATHGISTSSVVDNVIEYNREFGVAISNDGYENSPVVGANTIAHNGQGGIDIGLDGPTLTNVPAVTSAVYDPATGQTTIRGNGTYAHVTVLLFANSEVEAGGTSEGEQFLGEVGTDQNGAFVLVVPLDLRGRWIDGTASIVTDFGEAIFRRSTEFGPAARVTER